MQDVTHPLLLLLAALLCAAVQAVASRPDHFDGISLFNFDVKALYSISIVVFGFNCHANVVSVFYELEHYPSRLISRLPAKWVPLSAAALINCRDECAALPRAIRCIFCTCAPL